MGALGSTDKEKKRAEDWALGTATFSHLREGEDKGRTISEVRGKPGEPGVLEPSEARE